MDRRGPDLIAAGLLSHGIHEFIEAGWITVGTATAFDISGVLPDEGNLLGEMLRAVFGYSSSPEWITFLSWLGYILLVVALYLRPVRPADTGSVRQRGEAATNA